MPQNITDATHLQCNQGTISTAIFVTSQSFMSIKGKLQATEEDKQPNVNIKPFGKCKLKPTSGGFLPCIPDPIKWQETSIFEIEGKKELLDSSTCNCSVGGKIFIVKSTQTFVAE